MLIGIGGCSRSGKTELAEELVWHFRQHNKRAFSIHQDNYVFELAKIPTIKKIPDWDTPLSIDFGLVKQAIEFYKARFDVVIVEGIYAFNSLEINNLYDIYFYVEISKQTFWQRRSAETRWGIEPDWYIEHVWQSHQKYGVPSNLSEIHKVSGETPYDIRHIVELCHKTR